MTKIRLIILAQASLVLLAHMSSHVLALNINNTSVKCIEREKQALLALKQGIIDDSDRLSSWGSGEHEKECCEWKGVECSNRTGHVVKLDLRYERRQDNLWPLIRGTINSSLTKLLHLNYLDLSGISFQPSQFPKFICSLTHLKYLNLSQCLFRGKIPMQLWGLSNLVYLDLHYNELTLNIPHQLENLSSLLYLDLGGNRISGIIPHHLGNLSHLQYLDLGPHWKPDYVSHLSSDLAWVPHLISLRTLKLSGVNLSSAKNWQLKVSHLFHLQELDFSFCTMESTSPSLLNSSNNLAILNFYGIGLSGPIPEAFGNFSSLQELNLGGNLLKGTIPKALSNRCSLRVLILRENNLKGLLHDFVPTFHHCPRKYLQHLDLSSNQLTGSIHNLSQFSSLEFLDLGWNQLNGTLSESIGQLPNLKELSVRNNSLHGVISEAHFSKLSSLYYLDLSFNKLVLNISANWVPPFQLNTLHLSSCKLGPHFPKWLQTQKSLFELDISNAKINDIVPNWLWNISSSVAIMDLSQNQIRGCIANLSVVYKYYPFINLSSNMFEGLIPSFLSRVEKLDLSNNMFSNANSLLCPNQIACLEFLNLSNNELSGDLPKCWMNFQGLQFLDLSHNKISGEIPKSMGYLSQIRSLHLNNNSLVGEIPLPLSNCTQLRCFNAAGNCLSGSVPSWIGKRLQKLILLSLGSNRISGVLPSTICHLTKLQLLDLSLNCISGSIPKCINNLTSLATQGNSNVAVTYVLHCKRIKVLESYNDTASLMWKGKESIYKRTLGLVRSIDLSNNNLIGEIPSEIMDLVGLVSLNISRNMINGKIPRAIGQLKSLDSLDLSRNNLSGEIPSQISQINRSSVLDLSHNNLFGEIPIGTQLQSMDASAFEGNPKLCGAPLPEPCPNNPKIAEQNGGHDDGDDEVELLFTKEFFISMSIGFSVGLWAVCNSLLFKKSWRYAYFMFLSGVYDKLYVWVAINMNKLKRRIRA